jgi:HAD superfamily hydrolase (TIGR01484 family)
MTRTMRPLAEMPDAVAAGIRAVLTDIDDTLTTDGRLSAAAYGALERLKAAGFFVAAITGRPAGWCDMIARFWPLDGVVGENGAFWFAYDHDERQMRRVFLQNAQDRASSRARLERLAERIIAEVPGAAIAADQLYRESDLAIDFAEDVGPLPAEAVDRIVAIFEAEGATAKVSSIHVNGWFGAWDKLSTTRHFLAARANLDADDDRTAIVFCGDSPNDAPMFAHFPNACGVANVADFTDRITALPTWIASARAGAGFVEISDRLIAARSRAGKSELLRRTA